MIPVGVGRGLLGSYLRIVEQEIQDQKKEKCCLAIKSVKKD